MALIPRRTRRSPSSAASPRPRTLARAERRPGLWISPWCSKYFIWLGNMLQGDFGRSFNLNRPVLDEVLDRFNATLVLAGTSFILCSLLGIVAGVISAANQYGWVDKSITFVVLLGISIPSLLPRHDDDPDLRGEPALVPRLGHVADLRRTGSLGAAAPPQPCPRWPCPSWPPASSRGCRARSCLRWFFFFFFCGRISSAPRAPRACTSAASSGATRSAPRWCRSSRSSASRRGSCCPGAVYYRGRVPVGPASGGCWSTRSCAATFLLVQGGVIFVAACYVLLQHRGRRRPKPARPEDQDVSYLTAPRPQRLALAGLIVDGRRRGFGALDAAVAAGAAQCHQHLEPLPAAVFGKAPFSAPTTLAAICCRGSCGARASALPWALPQRSSPPTHRGRHRHHRGLLRRADRQRHHARRRHADGVSLHPAGARHRRGPRPRPDQRIDRGRGRQHPVFFARNIRGITVGIAHKEFVDAARLVLACRTRGSS